MRLLVCGVVAGLVLAAPAFGQSSSAAPAATAPSPLPKDSKPAAAPAGQAKPDPAPPAKDESMSNYDVNGSNASDAMGRSP